MARFDGSILILSQNEMKQFLEKIERPSPETIRRRKALFAKLDRMQITENADGSVDIPFQLPDIFHKNVMIQTFKPSESIVCTIGGGFRISASLGVEETVILAA